MTAHMTTPNRPCCWYESIQLLSTGRPLNEPLESPNPKISWNRVRGYESNGPQKPVRPLRLASSFDCWPRAIQDVIADDAAANAATAPTATAANSLRTRGVAAIRLRPPTRSPAIKATMAVLVWVSS